MKLLYQAIGKFQINTTKKNPGVEGTLFNCTGEMGMNNFEYLNSSLSLFLLCDKPAKQEFMMYVRLQLTPSPIGASKILAGPPLPPPSVYTLWMTPCLI